MTKEEWPKLVLSIKDLYPAEKILNTDHAIQLWYKMLKDLDYNDLAKGLWKYTLENKFPPTIADLRGQAASIKFGDFNTWEEEWQKVCKAIREYGYMREEDALNSLPKTTRIIVTRLGYQNLCASENPAVDRANFRDIYNNLINKQKEREKLSKPIRKVLDTATERRYAIPEQKPMELPNKMPEAESEDSVALSDVAQEGLRKLREVLKGE